MEAIAARAQLRNSYIFGAAEDAYFEQEARCDASTHMDHWVQRSESETTIDREHHQFDFAPSAQGSLGVELELQIIDARSGDLAQLSQPILDSTGRDGPLSRGAIVPEVSAGMIEISTGVCASACDVAVDLQSLCGRVACAASAYSARIAGGGMHPFKHWSEQQIVQSPRYRALSQMYGEVLKQTTVFGQHIHIGCADVERVPLLMHQLSRYVPHLIALSASSPFMEGRDTGFDSTRLNCPNPFPTGSCAPFLLSWQALTQYISKWLACGVIGSIKDLHWDIRPKPEFGTVEIRVLDSPLTVDRAASLACFAQLLARWLHEARPFVPCDEDALVYDYNKFQAARFGLRAVYVDPVSRQRLRLKDHIEELLTVLSDYAETRADEQRLADLRELARSEQNDASVLRCIFRRPSPMADVALHSAGLMEASFSHANAVCA